MLLFHLSNANADLTSDSQIKASCKMSLRKFPLDSQMCPLSVGSYGYTSDEVVYTWKKPAPLSLGNVGEYC